MIKASGASNFSSSCNGRLVYVTGSASIAPDNALVSVNRQGLSRNLIEAPGGYSLPRFSPDGQRVALTISGEQGTRNIWIYELARGTLARLTFDSGGYGAWAPDGGQVAFAKARGGSGSGSGISDIFIKRSDGTREARQLTPPENDKGLSPASWSSDGEVLVFMQTHGGAGADIRVLPLEGGGKPELLLQTPWQERHPKLSPDGRWLAYTSDESGQSEVYVQAFPDLGGKWLVSTEGGTEPVWSSQREELFYRADNKLMVVAYETGPSFIASKPVVLFEGNYAPNFYAANYDVSPDGQRFVMIEALEQSTRPRQLNVVLNWFEELRRLVPAN